MSDNNSENKSANKLFNWYAFPFPVLIVFAYLIIGFMFNVWHPTWILFLTIPIYYMMIATTRNNNWYAFPYPILVFIAYLCLGIFFNIWHPTWIIFLTVPIYYEMLAMNNAKNFKRKANIFPYPIICVIIYLALGFDYNWWHPGWLLFLTIPVYYMFVNSIKS